MKKNKIIFSTLIIFGLFGFYSHTLAVTANDMLVSQRNSTNDGNVQRDLPLPSGSSIFMIDGTLMQPALIQLGAGFGYDGSTLSVASSQIQADWTESSTTATDYIKDKPSFSTVATTGNYFSLLNLPASSTAQVQTDWNAVSGIGQILNKPTLTTVATTGSYTDLSNKPTIGIAYDGTTQRTNSFPFFGSATVSSGVAVFNITTDGTSGGTTLFPNGVIQNSVNLTVSDATAAYQMSYAFSNSNKTLTVTANKLTTANILSGILGQAQANGTVIKLQVSGY